MGGRITAPISASAVIVRRWPRWSGVSRITRMSGRPSLRVTSAARVRRLSARPCAMEAAAFTLHGTTTMPSVLKEPEAMEAPMSLFSYRWVASASTFFTVQSVSSTMVRLAGSETTRWDSTSGRLRRARPRCASQAEPPLVDLIPRLVVENFPLGAALGHRPRVTAEGLAHFLIDGLLEAAFLLEHAEHLGAELATHLLVRDLPDDDAFRRGEVAHDPIGQPEQPLPAHPHQRTNPRSRASLVLAMVKRRL